MTKQQNKDFAKLELAYLDQVREQNADGQIRQMEVIFYWIKKQITQMRLKIILELPLITESLLMKAIQGRLNGQSEGGIYFCCKWP